MPESPSRSSLARSWRSWPVLGALALSLTACPALVQSLPTKPSGVASTAPAARRITISPTQVRVDINVKDLVWKLTTVAPYRSIQGVAANVALNTDEVDADRITSVVAYPKTGGDPYRGEAPGYQLALEINKVYQIEVKFNSSGGFERVLSTLYKPPLDKRGKQGAISVDVTPATTLAATAVLQARKGNVASLDLEAFKNVVAKVDSIIDSNLKNKDFASSLQSVDLTKPDGLSEVLGEAKPPDTAPATGSASPVPVIDLVSELQVAVTDAARKDDSTNNLEPVGKSVEVEIPEKGQTEDQARQEAANQAGDLDRNREGGVQDAVGEEAPVQVPVAPTPAPSAPPPVLPAPGDTSGGNGPSSGEVPASTPAPAGKLWIRLDPVELFVPRPDGSTVNGKPTSCAVTFYRGDVRAGEDFKVIIYGPDNVETPYVQFVPRSGKLTIYPGAAAGVYTLRAYRHLEASSFEEAYGRFLVRTLDSGASEPGIPSAPPSVRPSVPPSPPPVLPTPKPWSGEVIIEDPTDPVDPPPFQGRDPWSGSVIIEDEPGVAQ